MDKAIYFTLSCHFYSFCNLNVDPGVILKLFRRDEISALWFINLNHLPDYFPLIYL